MSIILPTVPKEATPHSPRILVLYGLPKVGKTEFCSRLPNNLIIELDPHGAEQVGGFSYQVNNLSELTEVGREIIKANSPYKYVTIDTISTLEEWCDEDATTMYMNSTVGKSFNRYDDGPKIGQLKPKSEWESVLTLTKGAGYFWLRLSIHKWLDKFMLLAPYIILIAHIKEISLEKQGKEVSVKDLDLTGKIRGIISGEAAAIGYMYRSGTKGENLRISFQSNDSIICGARSMHLRGQDIEADWNKIYIQ